MSMASDTGDVKNAIKLSKMPDNNLSHDLTFDVYPALPKSLIWRAHNFRVRQKKNKSTFILLLVILTAKVSICLKHPNVNQSNNPKEA
jgi:hypothetical protein